MQIYLYQNEAQVGPYTEQQLRDMVTSGAIGQNEQAWHEGLGEWQPLNKIISFAPTRPAFPPPPKQLKDNGRIVSRKPINDLRILFYTIALCLIVAGGYLYFWKNKPTTSKSDPVVDAAIGNVKQGFDNLNRASGEYLSAASSANKGVIPIPETKGEQLPPKPIQTFAANDAPPNSVAKGQVYRTIDDQQAITIVSSDELELREGNENLICKYTKQEGVLRVVVNMLGQNQAVYFRITQQGLQESDGDKRIYFNPDSLVAARKAARLQIDLCEACVYGDLSRVKLLLENGANVNIPATVPGRFNLGLVNGREETFPIFWALLGDWEKQDMVSIVKLLLSKGAYVNQEEFRQGEGEHWTPLHEAMQSAGATSNGIEVILALVEAGADPNRRSFRNNGKTVFDDAMERYRDPNGGILNASWAPIIKAMQNGKSPKSNAIRDESTPPEPSNNPQTGSDAGSTQPQEQAVKPNEERNTSTGVSMPGERHPETRTRLLGMQDIQGWNDGELRYAINEMYARHGADFKDKEIKKGFVKFNWYQPRSGRSYDDAESDFSDTEKQNVKLLGDCRQKILQNRKPLFQVFEPTDMNTSSFSFDTKRPLVSVYGIQNVRFLSSSQEYQITLNPNDAHAFAAITNGNIGRWLIVTSGSKVVMCFQIRYQILNGVWRIYHNNDPAGQKPIDEFAQKLKKSTGT
jgi:hypothetical protein